MNLNRVLILIESYLKLMKCVSASSKIQIVYHDHNMTFEELQITIYKTAIYINYLSKYLS